MGISRSGTNAIASWIASHFNTSIYFCYNSFDLKIPWYEYFQDGQYKCYNINFDKWFDDIDYRKKISFKVDKIEGVKK